VQSDVYALGLLLYQLVIGNLRQPWAAGWERDIEDALLREDIAAATDGNPQHRLTSATELANRLRQLPARTAERERIRTLEQSAWVAAEALKRSRARRPWLIASMASLAIGLLITGWLSHLNRLAWLRAESERNRAQAINQFLDNDLLGAADPTGPGGHHDATIRDLLIRATGRLRNSFVNDPVTRASIELALGNAYFGLSDYAEAENFQRQAVELLSLALGGGDNDTINAQYTLARTLMVETRYDDAETLLAQADTAAGARLRENSTLELISLWSHASDDLMKMQPARALQIYEAADRVRAKVAPDDAQWLFRIRGNLAWCYVRLDRSKDAIDLLNELMSPSYPLENLGATDWAKARLEYGLALTNLGRFDEAAQTLKDALQQIQRVLGSDHYLTGLVWNHLGSVYQAAARWQPAIDAQSQAYAIMRNRLGDSGQATLITQAELATDQYLAGQLDGSLPKLETAHTALVDKLGAEAAPTQAVAFYLAAALNDLGHPAEAWSLAEKLQEPALSSVNPGSDWTQRLLGLKGAILQHEGKAGEARPLLETALRRLTEENAPPWVLRPLSEALEESENPVAIGSR
jgi:non-specific serine/threonine protein kinase